LKVYRYTATIFPLTITIKSGTDGATTLFRVNLSGYVGHVTTFSWMCTIACCLVCTD